MRPCIINLVPVHNNMKNRKDLDPGSQKVTDPSGSGYGTWKNLNDTLVSVSITSNNGSDCQ
jgi:hypothetical protein